MRARSTHPPAKRPARNGPLRVRCDPQPADAHQAHPRFDTSLLGNLPLGPREANPTVHIREGVSILTASRSTEPAIEADGRGVFTTLVCLALDGGAADIQGRTNVAGLFAYVEESLGSWQQRPLFKSHVSSLLCLRQVKPAVSLAELQRLTEFFPQANSEFALDPSYEHSHADAIPAHVDDYQVLVAYRNARIDRSRDT